MEMCGSISFSFPLLEIIIPRVLGLSRAKLRSFARFDINIILSPIFRRRRCRNVSMTVRVIMGLLELESISCRKVRFVPQQPRDDFSEEIGFSFGELFGPSLDDWFSNQFFVGSVLGVRWPE